jgi:hypothetical protein
MRCVGEYCSEKAVMVFIQHWWEEQGGKVISEGYDSYPYCEKCGGLSLNPETVERIREEGNNLLSVEEWKTMQVLEE